MIRVQVGVRVRTFLPNLQLPLRGGESLTTEVGQKIIRRYGRGQSDINVVAITTMLAGFKRPYCRPPRGTRRINDDKGHASERGGKNGAKQVSYEEVLIASGMIERITLPDDKDGEVELEEVKFIRMVEALAGAGLFALLDSVSETVLTTLVHRRDIEEDTIVAIAGYLNRKDEASQLSH